MATWAEEAPKTVYDSWVGLERSKRNKYVHISRAAIARAVETSPLVTCEDPDHFTPSWHAKDILPEDDREFARQIIVSSVANYAFQLEVIENGGKSGGNWIHNRLSDSFALHRQTNLKFGGKPDITSRDIRQVTTQRGMASYLPKVPWMQSRIDLFRDFANGLDERYDGSVQTLLDSSLDDNGNLLAFNDGDGLVERLVDKEVFGRAFEDYAWIDGRPFPFMKRALLAPLIICGRARTSKTLPKLADAYKLGPVIDYQLPRVEMMEGTLIPSYELRNKINNWEEIARESQPEVEIRGACAYVQTETKNGINELREARGFAPITIVPLDFVRWDAGLQLDKENKIFPHRTVTTAY